MEINGLVPGPVLSKKGPIILQTYYIKMFSSLEQQGPGFEFLLLLSTYVDHEALTLKLVHFLELCNKQHK